MVASQFFYALGYHVAENYIVRFDRPRLVGRRDRPGGVERRPGARRSPPKTSTGFSSRCRRGQAAPIAPWRRASPRAAAALLGPYQMWGTRSDDPNDTVPHEHRRDLRGMFVFAAWLNFSNMRAVSTQDILATVDGVPRIRHYVVDLTRSLGSGMFDGPKLVWEGNETVAAAAGRDRQDHRRALAW